MLQLINIEKKYNEHYVLRNINYSFKEGKVYFVIGDSGCGKTTLLNIIGGVDNFYEGSVLFNGIDVKSLSNKERTIYLNSCVSYVYQKPRTFNFLNGIDNIRLSHYISKERKFIKAKFLSKIRLRKNSKKYSSGEKQRISVQRCIDQKAKIILADEPTASLDKENKNLVMEELISICSNKILIIVTHDASLANQYADQILKIEKGRIKEKSNISKIEKTSSMPNLRKSLRFINALILAIKNFKEEKTSSMIYVTSLTLGIVLLIITNLLSNSMLDFFKEELIKQDNKVIEIDYEDCYEELSNEDYKFLEDNGVKLHKTYDVESISSFALIDDIEINVPFKNFFNFKDYQEERLSDKEIVVSITTKEANRLIEEMCVDLYGIPLEEYIYEMSIKLFVSFNYNDLYYNKDFYITRLIIDDESDNYTLYHNDQSIKEDVVNTLKLNIIDAYMYEPFDFFYNQDKFCFYKYNDIYKIKKSTENKVEKPIFESNKIDYIKSFYYNIKSEINYENFNHNFAKYDKESIVYGKAFSKNNNEILISKGYMQLFYEDKGFSKKRVVFYYGDIPISFDIVGVVNSKDLLIYYHEKNEDYILSKINNNYLNFKRKDYVYLKDSITYDELYNLIVELKEYKIECLLFEVMESMYGTLSSLNLIMNIFSILTFIISLVSLFILNMLDYEESKKEYSMLLRSGYSKFDLTKLFMMKNLVKTVLVVIFSIFSLHFCLSFLNEIFGLIFKTKDFLKIKNFDQIYIIGTLVYFCSIILTCTFMHLQNRNKKFMDY